jgi:hypothetical protein
MHFFRWPIGSHGSDPQLRSTMNPPPETRLFVERVRCFIKWRGDRFDALDEPHEQIADPVGWKRGAEHWIRPDTWRDTIFDGVEDAAQDAARTLRDLGLLRTQDSRNCQAVVCVRDRKSARAYVVKPEIREWRLTAPAYGAYDAAQIGLPYSQDNGSTALTPFSSGSPPDLAALLEAASRLGLEKAIAILTMQLDPESRHFQTLLRAQTALVSTALTAQVKVDEVRLQSNRRDDALPALLAKIEAALKAPDAAKG